MQPVWRISKLYRAEESKCNRKLYAPEMCMWMTTCYTDGKASASFDAVQVAAMEGSPYVLEVTDLTLKDDGTPDALSAYTDGVVYIEFNEDGLPSFFAVAQEDVGYQITYTRTDDGRLAMDSAQCVYGYIDNHSAEPTNDFFTPTGEILYQ